MVIQISLTMGTLNMIIHIFFWFIFFITKLYYFCCIYNSHWFPTKIIKKDIPDILMHYIFPYVNYYSNTHIMT